MSIAARPPGAPRAAVEPGSAGAALLDYLALHTDRLAAEERRVLRDEPDAVHQLRVACRRLRSGLQAFRPLLDRSRTDPIIADLRDFAAALSPARDAEVLRERISAQLAELPAELLLGPVREAVREHFTRVEEAGSATALDALAGKRYSRLLGSLDALLADPPLTRRARRAASTEVPALVARTARRLEAAVALATDQSLPFEQRDPAIHDARKAGKRLRYATEVARPTVGEPAQEFAKALKGFQGTLGEYQDTVVARETLLELAASATKGFSLGVLYAQETARAAEIERRLPDLWATAWTPEHTGWLTPSSG